MKKFIAAIAIAAIASVAYGQPTAGNVIVKDGVVTLNGRFNQLAGLEIMSEQVGTSAVVPATVGGVSVPGQSQCSIGAFGDGELPGEQLLTNITYGVLGADKAVTVDRSNRDRCSLGRPRPTTARLECQLWVLTVIPLPWHSPLFLSLQLA